MGKALDTIAPIAAGVIGSILLPGIGTALGATISSGMGAAVGSGLYSGIKNHSVKAGLMGGLGSYAGSALGSTLGSSLGTFGNPGGMIGGASNAIGPSFGSIGGAASSGLGSFIGPAAANSIGAGLANASIGGALGSYAGNSLALGGMQPQMPSQQQPQGPAPFKPMQADAMEAPDSLSGLGSLTPLQQSTNLATQGVYGGGLGPQEQSYFMNLQNRKLVDESGQTSGLDTLNPIENSYLARLGLGGQGSTNSLLEAMSKWSPA